MTLRELTRVYRERKKKSFAIETCAATGWKKKIWRILMTKMGLYRWDFKIMGPSQFLGPQAIA